MTNSSSNSPRGPQLALAVRIGQDLHAIAIDLIEEVLPALPIESVAQGPPFLRGVVFVRGHLIPVLDAAERLGLKNHRRLAEPHIVCLRVGSRLVGLEVDEAVDLIEVPPHASLSIEDVNLQRGFLAGFIERDGKIIRMLDATRMIAREEASALEPLPQTALR